jgi:uncharacterized protein YjdB
MKKYFFIIIAAVIILSATAISCSVEVNEIRLNEMYVTLEVGETFELTATVLPKNAKNKTVTWRSTQPDIATVSDRGTVTAVASGHAHVSASTHDMPNGVWCMIEVNNK